MTEPASPEIIKERFRKMGNGVIGREEIEHLGEALMRTFLTEPDTALGPPEISHLKKYA